MSDRLKLPPGVHTSLPLGDDPVAMVLNDAADLIEQRGHAKRCLLGEDGSLCVIGAINMAANGHQNYTNASEVIGEEFAVRAGLKTLSHVIGWNNADERTPEEVTARLRSAAASRAAAMVGRVER